MSEPDVDMLFIELCPIDELEGKLDRHRKYHCQKQYGWETNFKMQNHEKYRLNFLPLMS